VATGVADRARERIAQLIYVDAFVPHDGQCLLDLMTEEASARIRELSKALGEGWQIPPNPLPPDTPEDDIRWIKPRRFPQPFQTFATPLRLNGASAPPRTYIYCQRCGAGDVFRPFAERAQQEGWPYFEIDASHNPHITAPEALAGLLMKIAM
jgi:hypothetical protein